MKRLIAVLVALLALCSSASYAQSGKIGSDDEQRKEADALWKKGRLVDAYPLYQWLSKRYPEDIVILERLGFSMLGAAELEKDVTKQKAMRAESKKVFNRAKKLGDKSNFVHLADDIPEDGSFPLSADNDEILKALETAEQSFVRGDYEDAMAGYMRVIQLDPKNYEAHLFMGDVLFRTKRNEAAAEWYAKAVQIDPDRETAYRYWGDALDSSGKMEEARDKFIEAVVAEPYTRQSWIGLSQWAGRYHYRLGRPVVNLPAPSVDDKGHITINFNPANKKDDGSEADLLYSMTRSLWRGEKFEKAFPGVKTYRHSLAEEIDALTITSDSLLELKDKDERERLRPDLKLLLQIRSEGLLEPFVLLSMADEGIAQDYGAYRESHRKELKEFLQRFFLSEK